MALGFCFLVAILNFLAGYWYLETDSCASVYFGLVFIGCAILMNVTLKLYELINNER